MNDEITGYRATELHKGLHVTLMGEPKLIKGEAANFSLMCSGCYYCFMGMKMCNVYVEYYYEQSGGISYHCYEHLCSSCYMQYEILLENELLDVKEVGE